MSDSYDRELGIHSNITRRDFHRRSQDFAAVILVLLRSRTLFAMATSGKKRGRPPTPAKSLISSSSGAASAASPRRISSGRRTPARAFSSSTIMTTSAGMPSATNSPSTSANSLATVEHSPSKVPLPTAQLRRRLCGSSASMSPATRSMSQRTCMSRPGFARASSSTKKRSAPTCSP